MFDEIICRKVLGYGSLDLYKCDKILECFVNREALENALLDYFEEAVDKLGLSLEQFSDFDWAGLLTCVIVDCANNALKQEVFRAYANYCCSAIDCSIDEKEVQELNDNTSCSPFEQECIAYCIERSF